MRSMLLVFAGLVTLSGVALVSGCSDNAYGYNPRPTVRGGSGDTGSSSGGTKKDAGATSSSSSSGSTSSSGGSGSDAGSSIPAPTPPVDAGPPPAQCNAKCLPTGDGFICFAKSTAGTIVGMGCNGADGYVCTQNDQQTSEGTDTCNSADDAKSIFVTSCGCN